MNEPFVMQNHVALQALNTLGLEAYARQFAVIESAEELISQAESGLFARQRPFVLGGGSNVVMQKDVVPTVLHMRISGRTLCGEDDDAWFVRGCAGENWHDFVCWTLHQGWGGLENLALIPGTVGAAPIQNIGAYGLEVAERIHQVEAVDLRTGARRVFSAEECSFAYRDSFFKHDYGNFYAITAVIFRLLKRWQAVTTYADVANELMSRQLAHPSAQNVADAVVVIRTRKLPDPKVIGNAGSFFKNPLVDAVMFAALGQRFPGLPHYPQGDGNVKISAAWLIDQAGWKGRDLGPVGMYEKQALVLVNRGGAQGEDVLRLVQAVCASVQEKFGVLLEQEPVVV